MLSSSVRLLRLLTTLQSRRHWAGAELAERLEVTPRTLRRDVEKLRELGYAVSASTGPGGGYQLATGSTLPPLLLSDDEAVVLAAALRTATDTFAGVGDDVVALLVKIEQLLPRRLRRRVVALEAMTVSIGAGPRLNAELLMALAGACRDGVTLRFTYQTHDGSSSARHVEPLRLAHTGNRRWYLVAWDLDRADWRTFRVDRVTTPSPGERFVPRPPPNDLSAFVSTAIAAAPYAVQAELRLKGAADVMRARVPPWVGAIDAESDDSCVLRIGADSLDAVASLIVLTGVDVEVIAPDALAEHLRLVASRLVAPSAEAMAH